MGLKKRPGPDGNYHYLMFIIPGDVATLQPTFEKILDSLQLR